MFDDQTIPLENLDENIVVFQSHGFEVGRVLGFDVDADVQIELLVHRLDELDRLVERRDLKESIVVQVSVAEALFDAKRFDFSEGKVVCEPTSICAARLYDGRVSVREFRVFCNVCRGTQLKVVHADRHAVGSEANVWLHIIHFLVHGQGVGSKCMFGNELGQYREEVEDTGQGNWSEWKEKSDKEAKKRSKQRRDAPQAHHDALGSE